MKKTLLIVLFLLILIAIPVTVFLVKQRQDIRQRAVSASRIYIEPATNTQNVDDEFAVDIKLDTETNGITNNVTAADITIKFDPTYLEAVSIDEGSFFPNVVDVGQVDNQAGTASIALGDSSGSTGLSGVGETIATVTFKALVDTGSSPTLIEFSDDTDQIPGNTEVVAREGAVFRDVLIGRNAAQVIIGGTGTNPSPTPAASTLATPGPSATPGVSPTPVATPNTLTRVTAPANNATVTANRPTISGTTAANALVVISINTSPVLSSTVTASSTGAWTYTPSQDLSNGTYVVTVTGENASGAPETVTSTFTVSATGGPAGATPTPAATPGSTPRASASPAASGGGVATDSSIPVTGTTTPTFVLLGLAILFILFGSISTFFRRS